MEPQKKSNTSLWIIIVLVILAALYGAFRYLKGGTTSTPTDVTTPRVDTPQGATYKDGTYHAIGNYVSPGGSEQIDVTLTLKDNIITDANVLSLAFRPESKLNQGRFISGYKALVIGKRIDDVVLSKVSGSSLAPKGWNDAVAKIEAEAKA